MPIAHTQQVFSLVKSLTQSEKRNFKLYASRISDANSLRYLQLFDLIDKQKKLNETDIKIKLGKISAIQFANLKRHLFNQILITLRLLHKEKTIIIKIREYTDFALILYKKGLYLQALKLLSLAKKMANKYDAVLAFLSLLEMEKMIVSRHITRSSEDEIDDLVIKATVKIDDLQQMMKITNLWVTLHAHYIRNGFCKNKAADKWLEQTFQNEIIALNKSNLSPAELGYLYQCYVWYHYTKMEFDGCKKYSEKWVELYHQNTEMINEDIDLYMRAFHNLIDACYNLGDVKNFETYKSALELFRNEKYKSFSHNTKILSFLYVHTARLNHHFLKGTFAEGVLQISRTQNRIKRYKEHLDPHKIHVFYFKFACIYFGNKMYEKAITHLQKILHEEKKALRKDIYIYTRVLQIMCHYELNHQRIIPHLISTTKTYVKKIKDKHRAIFLFLKMFTQLHKAAKSEHLKIMQSYQHELKELSHNNYDKDAFLYLDVLLWLESKCYKKEISTLLKEKNSSFEAQ